MAIIGGFGPAASYRLGRGEGRAAPAVLHIPLPMPSSAFGALRSAPVRSTVERSAIALERDDLGRLLINIALAGNEPVPFLVDTAAPASMISTGLALHLGLDLVATLVPSLFTGKRPVRQAIVPNLSLGSLVFSDVSLVAGDVGQLAGVIGRDILSAFESRFDLANNRVELAIAGSFPASTGKAREPLWGAAQRQEPITLKGSIGGRSVMVLFDTGAEASLMNAAVADHLVACAAGSGVPPEAIRRPVAENGAGPAHLELELGGYLLSDLLLALAPKESFAAAAGSGTAAVLLGLDALLAFDVLHFLPGGDREGLLASDQAIIGRDHRR